MAAASLSFSYHCYFNSYANFGMQDQVDLVLTDAADRTFRQLNFSTLNFNANLLSNGISDITGTNRTKQTALFTRFRTDGNRCISKLFTTCSISSSLLSSNALKLGTACFHCS